MSDRQTTAKFAIPAIVGGVFLLSGCSTVQENPNYQYSSKYKAPETTDMATATPVSEADAAPIISASNSEQASSPTEDAYNAEAMTGTPGYAILLAEQAEARDNDALVEGTPAPTYPRHLQPRAASPQSPAQAPDQAVTGPREVTYDYAQNVIISGEMTGAPMSAPAPAPIPAEPSSTPITVSTARTYIVQPDDTVYSLSRRLCAPIADIVSANGIGSDFGIEIGQTLILPVSRC